MRIFDTALREKLTFTPQDPEDIRIYVCGPTVYDRIHLGNGRAAVVFDLLRRVLEDEHGAGSVRMVRNLTDVDDKINARAAERGVPIREITETTAGWFAEDVAALGTLRPHAEPRATEHISGMIRIIQRLLARGHAYEAAGHVFFDVASDPESGSLFRPTASEAISEPAENGKRRPEDFVLWKPSGAGQPAWESPWGAGRPGWHIECTAMIHDVFGGASIDIHGGGSDLMFPHHENEAAQHRCVHPEKIYARHWMHNGMITVGRKKMSKSLGNFITVRDVLDRQVGGDAVRLALLTAHYGRSLDWSEDLLLAAKKTASRWRGVTQGLRPQRDDPLVSALRDDLSTPEALSRMYHLEKDGKLAELAFGFRLLGLEDASPTPVIEISPEDAEKLDGIVERRIMAKKAKDWALADALRSEAESLGFRIRDVRGGGSIWEPAETADEQNSPSAPI